MARVFSLLVCLLSAAAAWGQGTFGRFGYGAISPVPGWTIGKEGFKAIHPLADGFQFPGPAAEWRPTETSSTGQTVSLGEPAAGGPSQLRENLYAPGFSLYFPNGIDLGLTSSLAPFLSWPEGTVGQTVPTPAVSWILVSFHTQEPPVLLVFPDGPAALVMEGSAGAWHLRTQGPFQGWVRVLLPQGDLAAGPTHAAGLGALSTRIAQNQALWSGPAPRLVDLKTEADTQSVTATWTFDRPGALIPVAASLAAFGGYPLKVQSPVARLEGDSPEGPLMLCKTETLKIRFPIREWPACRYLATGPATEAVKGGPLDVPGAVETAFQNLSASLDPSGRTAAGGSLMSYLSSAKMELEPATGQRLPYDASGAGYDLAAAHALLTQAVAASNSSPDLPNPLLSAIQARVDWYTWSPWNIPEDIARRGSALGGLAFAMRPEAEQRLWAGILQAGLSAERGRDLWRHWRGDLAQMPAHLEAMEALRKPLFALDAPAAEGSELQLLSSPLRLCSGPPLAIDDRSGKRMLTWTALSSDTSELELESPYALKLGGTQNLQSASLEVHGSRYLVRFKPKDVGACALELVMPPAAPPIPAASPIRYDEASR